MWNERTFPQITQRKDTRLGRLGQGFHLQEQKVDEDVDIETYSIRKSQRPPSPSQPKPTQLQADEEGRREEFRLVDPIPMPTPETLAQSIYEQPSGPQTRLVIHKIVLVNFMSYAWQRIIGPCHQVRAQSY